MHLSKQSGKSSKNSQMLFPEGLSTSLERRAFTPPSPSLGWGHPPLSWEVEGRGSEWEQRPRCWGAAPEDGSRVENGQPMAGSVPANGPTALGHLPVLSGQPPAASHVPHHWHQCGPCRLSRCHCRAEGIWEVGEGAGAGAVKKAFPEQSLRKKTLGALPGVGSSSLECRAGL